LVNQTPNINAKKFVGEIADWFIVFLIVIFLFAGTYQRNSLWNSEVELWKDCVKKFPKKERTHHNLDFAYHEVRRWDDAQQEYEETLSLNPYYLLTLYNLGLVYYKKGLLDEAIDYYRKAIELDSNFPDSLYNLGLAYHPKGLHKDALEAYEKLLRVKPDYENGHNNMGLAYQGLKKWERAIQSFREELRWHAHLYLGESYEAIKNYPTAPTHYKKALGDPNMPVAEKIRKVVSTLKAAQRQKKGEED
jgi:tetratricopeptide (TPR) repeat protein